MPRYQYECEACKESFEQRQSFSDDPLTDCPLCDTEGSVQRIITSVGVVFKGSGFYINDSKNGKKKNETSPKSNGKAEAKTEEKGKTSEAKKESSEQPAKAEAKKTESKKAD